MTEEKTIRVLLVEDTKTDAILIRNWLTKASAGLYDIQHVETLKEAVNSLAASAFDVVLLDLSLPDTSEFDGLIRIHTLVPHIPIIILTSHNDEDTAVSSVGHGAQDYLFKDSSNAEVIKRAIRYAMQRKQMEGNLFTRANYDALTELANRTFFENRLDFMIERSKRNPMGIAIFFLDLDRFKQVNDTLGHAAGDMLLKQVAVRIKTSTRPYDTSARFGGDEFALLLEDIKHLNDCVAVAEKIIHQISMPFSIGEKSVEVGVSIGIATNLDSMTVTRENLMQQADRAMYMAKMRNGSCYNFYDAQAVEAKKAGNV